MDNKYYYYPVSTETTTAAYVNRHKAIILNEYNPDVIKRCIKHLHQFKTVRTPLSEDEYCQSMPTSYKRNQYNQALTRLRNGGKVSSKVRPFTKIEKMPFGKYKTPRMIHARDITFNIKYGRFIKPLEEYVT